DLCSEGQADLLDDALRGAIFSAHQTNEPRDAERAESGADDCAHDLGGDPPAPHDGHERVSDLDLISCFDDDSSQASATDKSAGEGVAPHPDSEAMLCPVAQVRLEIPRGLRVGTHTAEGGHQ